MASFATPAELSAYTKGNISPTDGRSQLILNGASEAIRRYAGWNIAPAEDMTVTLDGGGKVLYLPSLKVNSLDAVTIDGVAWVSGADYEWSRRTGNVRRRDGSFFPDSWGGIEVTFNSGYAETPADLKSVVLQVSSIALSSPTGATREQAGQVAMEWATTAPGVAGGLSLLARDLAVVNSYRLPKEV
ncbi:head-to-tail adaptor [Microbacterium phage Avocadoman]|uniref:head-to-tail adaptor n=1 Tax=Microbacterium phage Avocadoman TaxID=2776864 RepID=UPI0018A4D46F|nr:head-to-tail adaptor [Microbacterium phage Avocadoman]QOP64837.1 head-to-tail adaptor [Microbacterium phage Avocadoman]